MAITIYDQLVPVFSHMLSALDKVLTKAEADAAARKIDPDVFVNYRLAPDMFPLVRQIQIMTDGAKGCASRLAGQEPPKWTDDEKTFADLHARIAKTIAHLQTFKPEQFEGAEKRAIEMKFPNATFNFTGKDYFLNFVIPNFYFHYTTAYAILRHNGVPIGKGDFLGNR
ncbi:MAG TPA: DUF1993 domain-containing protein [Gammaproteobacteria bacterium]|nr:DUF1993 domain-containing protein [Gammaproteobacteria bacterium]